MKKGFTLVELLAVVIILGILSVLIVPKVINTLNDSEEKTNIASANKIITAAEYTYEQKEMNGISEDIIIDYTNDINTDKIEFKGKKPEAGMIRIKKNGKISMAIKIGNNCFIKQPYSTDITKQAYDIETCKSSKSFAEDSWADIKSHFSKSKDAYDLGEEKEIVIDNTTYKVRISNKTSCSADWEGSETACGVVIEFVELLTEKKYMNPTNTTVGGWPASYMRSYLNETRYNKLPQELKNIIIDTKVISGYNEHEGTENYVSTDKMYLLSTVEINGSNANADTVKNTDTHQLEYYEEYYSRNFKEEFVKRVPNECELALLDGCTPPWWLRSAFRTLDGEFLMENDIEYIDIDDLPWIAAGHASYEYGVSPVFRILD